MPRKPGVVDVTAMRAYAQEAEIRAEMARTAMLAARTSADARRARWRQRTDATRARRRAARDDGDHAGRDPQRAAMT